MITGGASGPRKLSPSRSSAATWGRRLCCAGERLSVAPTASLSTSEVISLELEERGDGGAERRTRRRHRPHPIEFRRLLVRDERVYKREVDETEEQSPVVLAQSNTRLD